MKGVFANTFGAAFGTQQGTLLNYEPEVKLYISGLTTPLSKEQIVKVDIFVKSLKAGLGISALSDMFDVMYLLAGETSESSLRNLVKRAHDATAINNPNFEQYKGFKSNGSTSYLNLNYNPSSSGINYTLNNASIAAYPIEESAINLQNEIGSATSPITTISNINLFDSNNYSCRINEFTAGYGIISYNPNGTNKLAVLSRSSVSDSYLHHNGQKILDNGSTSNTIPNYNLYGLCRNNAGTPGSFSLKRNSFMFAGRSINNAEYGVIRDAIENYLGSNGVLTSIEKSVVFTFDDGYNSWHSLGKPLFEQKGSKFTGYIIPSRINTSGYMTDAQVQSLYSSGFDLQCHTNTHPNMTTLTEQQILSELTNVNNYFASIGLPAPRHLAYPYGANNSAVKSVVSTMRDSARLFNMVGVEIIPFADKYAINTIIIDELKSSNINVFKAKVDELLIKNTGILVFVAHNLVEGEPESYQTNVEALGQLIDYVKMRNIPIRTISDIYNRMYS